MQCSQLEITIKKLTYDYRVLSIYCAAVLLRAWQLLSAGLTGDNATTGLMGLAVLRGEFPYFFFGQNWMGGLDAILAAPIYALLGPSVLTVHLLSPIFSLAMMVCLQPILRKILGYWGMVAGLIYLAVPPTTWLFWSVEAQTHYTLGLLLSSVLLLITFKLWQNPVWKWHTPVWWGLIAGVALWTNFSSAVVTLPCGIFLLLMARKHLRVWSIPLAIAGGIVGGFPLIWFNLTHGMVHANQAGVFATRYLAPSIAALATNALPLILGINTPEVSGGPIFPYGIAPYTFLLAMLGAGIFFLFRYSRGGKVSFACLLLAVFLLNMMIVVSSAYGKTLFSPDQRYLLSLYLILPFLVGATVRFVIEKRRWCGVILMLAIPAIHFSQYPGFQRWGQGLLNIKAGFYFSREEAFKNRLREISAAGFKYVYTNQDTYPMDFLGNGDPVAADYWRHRWLTSSLRVDAASDPGLLNMPQGSLNMLGLDHQTWRREISHAFSQPTGASHLLPRSAWTARRVAGGDLGKVLNDGDLATGFRSLGKAKDGDALVVDLRDSQEVGGLALIPAEFRQVPRGLKIEVAGVDGKFQTVRQAKSYWGPFYLSGPHPFLKARFPRVESYFPPRDIRYLRLTHLGMSNHPWTIQELLLFGPGETGVTESWEDSAEKLMKSLASHPARRLYGDAWISAKVAQRFGKRIWVITGNMAVDNFGTTVPSPYLPLTVKPEPGSAVVVTKREARQTASHLRKWGVRYREQAMGRFIMFSLEGYAMGPSAEVKRVSSPEGESGTSIWQTKNPHGVELGWLRLEQPPGLGSIPSQVEVKISQDGMRWNHASVIQAGPLAFSGQVMLLNSGQGNLYRFTPPVRAHFLKIQPILLSQKNWPSQLKISIHKPE